MTPVRNVPRCSLHPKMSPCLESRANGSAWVFICTACSQPTARAWGSKVLGLASIHQPGFDRYTGTLRRFSWSGQFSSLDSPYQKGVDVEWLFEHGFPPDICPGSGF